MWQFFKHCDNFVVETVWKQMIIQWICYLRLQTECPRGWWFVKHGSSSCENALTFQVVTTPISSLSDRPIAPLTTKKGSRISEASRLFEVDQDADQTKNSISSDTWPSIAKQKMLTAAAVVNSSPANTSTSQVFLGFIWLLAQCDFFGVWSLLSLFTKSTSH